MAYVLLVGFIITLTCYLSNRIIYISYFKKHHLDTNPFNSFNYLKISTVADYYLSMEDYANRHGKMLNLLKNWETLSLMLIPVYGIVLVYGGYHLITA